MRLLLVEDDSDLVARLRPALQRAGYAVEVSADGIDAEFRGSEEDFDAVILDLGLPGRGGFEVLAHWRATGSSLPVLVLTGRDGWQDRVAGLRAGADDYLGKPFHPEELLARIEALIRRRFDRPAPALTAAGLELDLQRQSVRDSSGAEHALTGIEFRILRYLMTHAGSIVSKLELSGHVYEEDSLRDSNVLEVYVNRLRKRFGQAVIVTHRGQGYRMPGTSESGRS